MNDYFAGHDKEHRALAAVTLGAEHRAQADQYKRLSGSRDLYRKSA
jgi:hypothetical protein